VPKRRIHASGAGSVCGRGWPIRTPCSRIAFWIGNVSGGAMMMPKPSRKVSRSRRVIDRLAGHRVVDRPVEPAQDPAVGQLGQQPVHRLVEPQPALLHKDQGRDGRDRLGHGGDAFGNAMRQRPRRFKVSAQPSGT